MGFGDSLTAQWLGCLVQPLEEELRFLQTSQKKRPCGPNCCDL